MRESSQAIKYSRMLRLATPLHVGAPGQVRLACLPPAALAAILATLELIPLTDRAITDRVHLLAELAIGRQRGQAVSEGARAPWTSAVAAPLWDWSGKLIATVRVLGPSQRLSSESLPGLSQQVALELSAALGSRPQRPPYLPAACP
jgi:DNA-binding IclR family transcriptional regulator